MTCPSDEMFGAWVSGALPERELERLSAHAADCDACRGLAVAMVGLVPRSRSATLGAVGGMVGRYQVTGSVGHGAMGIVLRGRDPVLERDVAIKMVNAIAATTEQRSRMLQEARMLALVDHPNVVRVHDAGLVDDEVFVVMEYVVGTTLEAWLAQTARPLAARLEVLVGVGAGLAAIHAAGVVHRDIKPDNILVRDGRGVIVDLGLARSSGHDGSAGSGIVGTPRFLAPEVRRGERASARADQFAWWTVVRETLADAELPARRRNALDQAIQRGRVDEPSQRFATMTDAVTALTGACRPARYRRLLPALGALVLMVIGGWIVLRSGSATAPAKLADCASSPAKVRAAWAGARDQIHQAFLATGVPYAQTSFDGLARVYDAYVPALASRLAAACGGAPAGEPQLVTVARRRCLDARVDELDAQLERLTVPRPLTVEQAVDGAWAVAEPMCDDPRALLFGPFGTRPISPALAQRLSHGRERLRAGEIGEGVQLARALVADARRQGDQAAELGALHLLGDLFAHGNQVDAAIDAFQDALRLAEARGSDLDAAKMLTQLAEQYGDKRDAASGQRMIALARAKLVRIGGNPVLEAALHRLAAHIFDGEYRCRDAEAEIRKALALFERISGTDNPRVGMTLSELANLSCSTTAETVDAARRSLTILERAYGADHPNAGGARVNLAVVLNESGQAVDAREQLVQADAIFIRAHGADHPIRISALLLLGDVESELGHHEAALEAYRRAGTMIDATAGPRSTDAGALHRSIGDAFLARSEFANALQAHRRALAILEQARGAHDPALVDSLRGIAQAQLGLGQPARAVPFAERALAVVSRDPEVRTEALARIQWLLARALWASGADRTRARALAEQARRGDTALTGEVDRWLKTRRIASPDPRDAHSQ